MVSAQGAVLWNEARKVLPRIYLPKFWAILGVNFLGWIPPKTLRFMWVEGPNRSENSWEGFGWFVAIERLFRSPACCWKRPRTMRAMRGKALHTKFPQSTAKATLLSNKSYESKTGCNRTNCALGSTEFLQKALFFGVWSAFQWRSQILSFPIAFQSPWEAPLKYCSRSRDQSFCDHKCDRNRNFDGAIRCTKRHDTKSASIYLPIETFCW